MAMNFDEEVSPHSHTDGSHGTWLLSEAAASENAEHNEEAVAFLEKMWRHHNHITDNSCAADVVGYTALHHAVRAKDLSAIRKLLQYSDERFVNKEGNDCSTALRIVCKNFTSSDVHEEILQEVILVTLLDAGANPNLPQKYRFSLPLMHALKNHWWRGVELLLDAGAQLTKDSYERCKPPDSFFTRVSAVCFKYQAALVVIDEDTNTILFIANQKKTSD
ncbi:uncharacterized protein LOC108666923 [Hyalella azteca]|uniref:Uncharacterized protein LOC108666923 n=1 Tax=Hyalella azteca TaxID=294128 RepID=A0A8B7N7W8_HYAAZ|nr:uncharacterized protein LOC108666923 [Hyalella azteca]XP_047740932.1 uncharacterized protein LOC108666923 [Hyalella azteca]